MNRLTGAGGPSLIVLALVAPIAACGDNEVPFCAPPVPPAEAMLHAGDNDGVFVLPGGRRLTPTGRHVPLGGFPVEVVLHPTADAAIVNDTGYAWRGVHVVRRSDGAVVQSLQQNESFHGMSLASDGATLYVAGGDAGLVDVYRVDAATGELSANVQIDVPGYPVGALASADGTRLWVGTFSGASIEELDTAGFARLRSALLPCSPFALLEVAARREIYVTCIRNRAVQVVDRDTFTVVGAIALDGDAPTGLAASPDGARVYVTVPDGDLVVAIDTATRTVARSREVGDRDAIDEDGTPLNASSPTGIAFDPANDRLLVARSADNSVAILDASTLDPLAAIPVGWYPTDVAIDGTTVAVANGKGIGAGPTGLEQDGEPENKAKMTGTLSLFDLADVDLAAATAQAAANLRRPDEVFRHDCGGLPYPVPTAPGGPTPIEHIVLVVKENKTYDSVLGDLDGTEADRSLLMWGEEVTPNLHALAREFANHDNFYDDGESSIQGHLWLTGGFVTDYVERVSYLEDYRGNPGWSSDAISDAGQPDFGTFFTHLIEHGVSFRIFGEITGFNGSATNPDGMTEEVASHLSSRFPGLFYNTGVKDELKAQAVLRQFRADGLPRFSYVLLPNDHTNGLSPDALTPEAMISDNDYAVGLLVEGISQLPEWRSTAVFIVQDDTQSGADHIDLHRSLLIVASPWARRGATSHVHMSYPSLFRSFEHILGLPPMNRYDARATLVYDSWTARRDDRRYTARPRQIEDRYNRDQPRPGPGVPQAVRWSQQIDWSKPDASPDLGDILWVARFGKAPSGSRLARVIAGELPDDGPRGDLDDADAYDEELARARTRAARDPVWRARFIEARLYEDDDDGDADERSDE